MCNDCIEKDKQIKELKQILNSLTFRIEQLINKYKRISDE